MSNVLVFARLTLVEAGRRKVIWALAGLAVVIIGLSTWGFVRLPAVHAFGADLSTADAHLATAQLLAFVALRAELRRRPRDVVRSDSDDRGRTRVWHRARDPRPAHPARRGVDRQVDRARLLVDGVHGPRRRGRDRSRGGRHRLPRTPTGYRRGPARLPVNFPSHPGPIAEHTTLAACSRRRRRWRFRHRLGRWARERHRPDRP